MFDYADAWDQYDLAVNALYDALGIPAASRGPVSPPTDVTQPAYLAIAKSGQLATAAAQGLTAPTTATRGRSMLRLIAAAAADLAIANDLAFAQPDQLGPVLRRAPNTMYHEVMAELGPILQPGAVDTRDIVTRRPSIAPRQLGPEEALTQLRQTASRTFDAISDDVVAVGRLALGGLFALQAAPVTRAAAIVVQEIISLLSGELSPTIRHAARFVLQAYDKMLQALGRDAASQARVQAAQWIASLESANHLGTLLERLYEKPRILADIEAYAGQRVQVLSPQALRGLLGDTRNLASRFQRHRQILDWIVRGLAFTEDWLFTIEPAGPLAVTALYVSTVGYVVYVGGDYVDWFRTDQIQPLNHVSGLRHTVRTALAEAKPEAQPVSSMGEIGA